MDYVLVYLDRTKERGKMTELFTHETCQDGYVIYYQNRKIEAWQVQQILNDFFEARKYIIEAVYKMQDSEKKNIHNFLVRKK